MKKLLLLFLTFSISYADIDAKDFINEYIVKDGDNFSTDNQKK